MATYRKIKDLSTLDVEGNKKRKTRKTIWWIVTVVLFVATIFGAYAITHPEIFKAKKKITVEIHHSDYSVDTVEIVTRGDNWIDVLVAEGLIKLSEDGKSILAAGDPHSGLEELYFDTVHWLVYEGDGKEPVDPFALEITNKTTYRIVFTSI